MIDWLIEDWDPELRPVHCSNCVHARVHGAPDLPLVKCVKGHGAKTLSKLIRRRPIGFRVAAECENFEAAG